jgi:hypothetical protein
VISTVDTEARHTRKSKSNRKDGFRGHVSAEPDSGLITDAELTSAAGQAGSDAVVGEAMIARDRYHADDVGDAHAGVPVAAPATGEPRDAGLDTADHGGRQPDCAAGSATGEDRSGVAAEVDTGLATATAAVGAVAMTATGAGPGLQVYGDSAYGTGQARAAYARGGHHTVIKPKPLHPAVPGGFTLDDFTVNEQAQTVTCPAGHTRPMSPTRAVTFGALCTGCPLRTQCTTAAAGRSMSIHEHEQLLRAAREQARTPEFKRDYPIRSSVERIIAWVATQHGRRVKLRYHGVAKNHAWLRNRAAAINLRTLVNAGLTHRGGAWALA